MVAENPRLKAMQPAIRVARRIGEKMFWPSFALLSVYLATQTNMPVNESYRGFGVIGVTPEKAKAAFILIALLSAFSR